MGRTGDFFQSLLYELGIASDHYYETVPKVNKHTQKTQSARISLKNINHVLTNFLVK